MYVVQNQGCMQIGYKGFQFLALDIFDNKIKTLNPTLGGVSTHATLPNTENAIKTKKILWNPHKKGKIKYERGLSW